ncbi:MAG TPA: MFS transporter [Ignavibacteria bacterium]|nr:MFS transporter [Ignavibacteria bacterium]
MQDGNSKKKVATIVLVSALGYFVDIYDLVLFGIVRVASLKALGLTDAEVTSTGIMLLNMQMGGMLVGGILWGILGDKKGRVSILFGSIILYSVMNVINGFVTDIPQYAIIRFLAGIGLAGELGAGITLVSETMSKEKRGYGNMIVAGVGVLGAVVAALVGDLTDWRNAYFIGGGMGFLILLLRVGVYESGMYTSIKHTNIPKGAFLKLFTNKKMFFKFLNCILLGLPLWFAVGVLVTFSPEFGKAFGFTTPVKAGLSIMFAYIGISAGDFLSGWISQILKSRKKVIHIFVSGVTVMLFVFLFFNKFGTTGMYVYCGLIGFACGYWVIMLSNASEQFGTNMRATVTTSVPNFIRGSVILSTLSFQFLNPITGIVYSALIVGLTTIIIAFIATSRLEETFGKDLGYVEII